MDRKDILIIALCFALVLALLWGITRGCNWQTDSPCECCQMGGAIDGDESGPLCLTMADWPP